MIATHPMSNFSTENLRFIVEAREAIQFGPQPGTALRGALYNALCELFSPNAPIPGLPMDPVRHLLEGEDEQAARGRDIPRAFAIEPPLRPHWSTGQRFEFGVTLFGTAIALAPYILHAARRMGEMGVGAGRGQFQLIRVDEFNPLNESRRALMEANRVSPMRLTVEHQDVTREARRRQDANITLRFLTPMRLVDKGQIVDRPELGVLMRRLLERAQAVVEYYSEPDCLTVPREVWQATWEAMGQAGDQAERIIERMRWVDIDSYSTRRSHSSPIGGFIGDTTWTIHETALVEWLLWGQCLHVGKNAAKGNGWYMVL